MKNLKTAIELLQSVSTDISKRYEIRLAKRGELDKDVNPGENLCSIIDVVQALLTECQGFKNIDDELEFYIVRRIYACGTEKYHLKANNIYSEEVDFGLFRTAVEVFEAKNYYTKSEPKYGEVKVVMSFQEEEKIRSMLMGWEGGR